MKCTLGRAFKLIVLNLAKGRYKSWYTNEDYMCGNKEVKQMQQTQMIWQLQLTHGFVYLFKTICDKSSTKQNKHHYGKQPFKNKRFY